MPPVVVTVMSTVPDPAGLVAVIEVALLTVNGAIEVPKCTAVAPVKPVPVIITLVPPPVAPAVGEMLVTPGGVRVNVPIILWLAVTGGEKVYVFPVGVTGLPSTVTVLS